MSLFKFKNTHLQLWNVGDKRTIRCEDVPLRITCVKTGSHLILNVNSILTVKVAFSTDAEHVLYFGSHDNHTAFSS